MIDPDWSRKILLHAAGSFEAVFGPGDRAPIPAVMDQIEARDWEYQAPLDVEEVRIVPVANDSCLSQEDIEISRANTSWAQELYNRSHSKLTPFQPGVHETGE